MQQLQSFRQLFDTRLQAYMQRKLHDANIRVQDAAIVDILAYAQELIEHGGKRIRPYLASIGYRAIQPRMPSAALEVCMALELFHVFALIHDDVMDQGQSRHGIPTTHIHVTQSLRKQRRVGDMTRTGESQAILVGDLLLGWATEMMSGSYRSLPLRRLERARELFFQMTNDVILGQMLDVDLMTRKTATFETIERKMFLKTASYTFIKPFHIGVALAGGGAKSAAGFERIGYALGLAFQIQDDLLDLTGLTKDTHKTVFSDLVDRQHTVFTLHIFQHGTKAQKQTLQELFGTRLTETDRPQVAELFTQSGAFEYGRTLMEEYFQIAEQEVSKLHLSSSLDRELMEFIGYIKHRTS